VFSGRRAPGATGWAARRLFMAGLAWGGLLIGAGPRAARAGADLIAEAGGDWSEGAIRPDARARLETGLGDLSLRHCDRRLLGFAEARTQGWRCLAGALALHWGAGCALAEEGGLTPWVETLPAPGAGLLRAAGTSARRETGPRGWLVEARRGRTSLAGWRCGEGEGGAFMLGPCGVALVHSRSAPDPAWIWSLAGRWRATDAPASRDDGTAPLARSGAGEGLVIEVAGRRARSEERDVWIGGGWRFRPAPELGSVRCSWRWRAPGAQRRLAGAKSEQWSLEWELPWLEAASPQVVWSVRQLPAARLPHALLERSLLVRLTTELWKGATLRCGAGATQAEQWLAGVGPDRGPGLGALSGARVDLDADFRLAPGLALAIRSRRRGLSRSQPAETRSLWEAARESWRAEETLEIPDDALGEWESSSHTWLRIQWQGAVARAGCALAAAARENSASSLVPRRQPPGRTQWRRLGPGDWELQAWFGRRAGAIDWEVVARAGGGRREGEPDLALLAGLRWRLMRAI